MNSCEYVLIHHSVIEDAVQFNRINEEHKARGFPISSLGYYVGYHYVIGTNGTIKAARIEQETGAHCAAQGMNYKALGICIAGDFREGRVPTLQQIKSLALLLKDIKARHQIPDTKILRHGDVKPTQCPGEWDFRRVIADYWANVTQEDASARNLQDRFMGAQAEYNAATTIAERNHFQRILDRIQRVLHSAT